MDDKLVSVIIPIYNAERSLNKCIRSVVQQQGTVEVILIDDGSTDNSLSICKEWESKKQNVFLYRQENSGVSVARNLGLSKASGQYILFVDADDALPDNSIANYMKYDVSRYDLIIGSYREVGRGPKKGVIRNMTGYDDIHIKKDFDEFDSLLNTPWGKLYKREIIEQHGLEFDVGRPFGEDHVFNLKYSQYIKECLVVSDIVYDYTLGGVASSIKYYPDMNCLNRDLLEEYLFYYCDKEDDYFKRKLKDQFMGSIMHYVSNCDDAEAVRKVNQTLDVFSDYLSDEYLGNEYYSEDLIDSIKSHDARHIISVVKKDNWKRLCLKKVKRLLIKANKYIKG